MESYRIETEAEVNAYLGNLRYALQNGAQITFQSKRLVDDERDIRYTNEYTVATLFPDEDPVEALRRELLSNSVFGAHTTFVMSFHFAVKSFNKEVFPYCK